MEDGTRAQKLYSQKVNLRDSNIAENVRRLDDPKYGYHATMLILMDLNDQRYRILLTPRDKGTQALEEIDSELSNFSKKRTMVDTDCFF